MEFQVTVTIADHGAEPENGFQFMRGFWETHPEVGAVVDQNTDTGELSITFAFEAKDLLEAGNVWPRIFVEGAQASGLPPTKLKKLAMAADVVKVVPTDGLKRSAGRECVAA